MPNPNENLQNQAIIGVRNHAAAAAWFQRAGANSVSVNDRWLLISLPAKLSVAKDAPQIEFQQTCVLPGAFNPLHDAHRKMAKLANEKTGKPVFFELDVNNIDKPSLGFHQLVSRVTQNFQPSGLILSRSTTFLEKSGLYPGTTFVVGADTIQRIGDLKYYDHCEQALESAITQIAENHCRFLVFGRKIGNNFVEAKKTILSAELLVICDFVDRREFDMEISSTDIRRSTQ